MKNFLLACMAAALLFGVPALSGCGREGPEDDESAIERMKEIWAGGGKEMEEHEGPDEHMSDEDIARHEMEEHGAMMEKQHEAMRTMAGEWMKARGAAIGGVPGDAVEPARKMGEAAGHIDEFMLHRGGEQKEDFLRKSREFKSLLMRFTTDAEQGNKESLRQLATKIDSACNDCHQSFR